MQRCYLTYNRAKKSPKFCPKIDLATYTESGLESLEVNKQTERERDRQIQRDNVTERKQGSGHLSGLTTDKQFVPAVIIKASLIGSKWQ